MRQDRVAELSAHGTEMSGFCFIAKESTLCLVARLSRMRRLIHCPLSNTISSIWSKLVPPLRRQIRLPGLPTGPVLIHPHNQGSTPGSGEVGSDLNPVFRAGCVNVPALPRIHGSIFCGWISPWRWPRPICALYEVSVEFRVA